MSQTPYHAHANADLKSLSMWRLRQLRRAANAVLTYSEHLGQSGTSPVAELLHGAPRFLKGDHYPPGDVYDEATGSQYYYHAHRSAVDENGHFHIFLRHRGMPSRMRLLCPASKVARPLGDEAIAHLVAVSIGHDGLPVRIFAPHQWVTGETFYEAPDLLRLIDRFKVEHPIPSLATNRWLTALVHLFRPQIATLLQSRDRTLADWQARHPRRDLLKARELEILAELPVDIDTQISDIDREVERRRIETAITKSRTV